MTDSPEPGQRERAPEALIKSAAALTRAAQAAAAIALTASIAHEIRQPLSGLAANADACRRMLAADPPDITGAQQTIRRTLRDISRVSELVTRLRSVFGAPELRVRPFDLNEAVREAVSLLADDLGGSDITVGSSLADGLPQIVGDRAQLQLVIANLLCKACEAPLPLPPRARELLVKTGREPGNRVRVTIRDPRAELAPMSSEALLRAAHTMASDGMGIGLFVSRSIIERHQGRLWAEATPGVPGTTFSFSVPCAAEAGLAYSD